MCVTWPLAKIKCWSLGHMNQNIENHSNILPEIDEMCVHKCIDVYRWVGAIYACNTHVLFTID